MSKIPLLQGSEPLQALTYLVLYVEVMFIVRNQKVSFVVAIVIVYASIIAIIAFNRYYPTCRAIGYVSSFIIGSHYIFVIVLALYIFLWFIGHRRFPNEMSILSVEMTAIALLLSIIGYTNGAITKVNNYTIVTDKVQNNIRIVHISDLHLCNMYGEKDIRVLVNKINLLNPDIVCITGDMFVGHYVDELNDDAIYKEFRRLNPTYGTFVCLGNHDMSIIPKLEELCYNSRFRLLVDTTVDVGGISITGRNCSPNGIKLVDLNINNEDFNVVLDHIPCRIDEESDFGIDLVLSGHTHGKQLLPISIVMSTCYKIHSGAKWFNKTFVVVNQGPYNVYPYMRLHGESEIVCIDVVNN